MSQLAQAWIFATPCWTHGNCGSRQFRATWRVDTWILDSLRCIWSQLSERYFDLSIKNNVTSGAVHAYITTLLDFDQNWITGSFLCE